MLKSPFAQSVALLAAFGAPAAIAQPAIAQDAVQQRPAAFVDAGTMVPGLIPEMRYATAHNFTGRPIDGYEARRCLLTREAAEALANVARDLAPRGFVIKAFDCYRPTSAVENFVRWARDINDQAARAEFYPNVDKRTLFRDGYIASHSGHSRGSTIDMTLARADGTELDMGTHFDFFSPSSSTADPTVTAEQHANRMLLVAAMRRRGFRNYEKEWWHFTLTPEPFPDTYFNFPVR